MACLAEFNLGSLPVPPTYDGTMSFEAASLELSQFIASVVTVLTQLDERLSKERELLARERAVLAAERGIVCQPPLPGTGSSTLDCSSDEHLQQALAMLGETDDTVGSLTAELRKLSPSSFLQSCACGGTILLDSEFCRKCGAPRLQVDSSSELPDARNAVTALRAELENSDRRLDELRARMRELEADSDSEDEALAVQTHVSPEDAGYRGCVANPADTTTFVPLKVVTACAKSSRPAEHNKSMPPLLTTPPPSSSYGGRHQASPSKERGSAHVPIHIVRSVARGQGSTKPPSKRPQPEPLGHVVSTVNTPPKTETAWQVESPGGMTIAVTPAATNSDAADSLTFEDTLLRKTNSSNTGGPRVPLNVLVSCIDKPAIGDPGAILPVVGEKRSTSGQRPPIKAGFIPMDVLKKCSTDFLKSGDLAPKSFSPTRPDPRLPRNHYTTQNGLLE
eukprot:TRINITY_DN90344_c0_g1_i1.p1 TRINITY_DN90344_c0_g1~~TRINITY_DN90344_c0_g1_i1.p1  ORF type:complete len:450 (+),score=62.86 TRINITY_DN90344_c0_g1_i1:173-1522(+)